MITIPLPMTVLPNGWFGESHSYLHQTGRNSLSQTHFGLVATKHGYVVQVSERANGVSNAKSFLCNGSTLVPLTARLDPLERKELKRRSRTWDTRDGVHVSTGLNFDDHARTVFGLHDDALVVVRHGSYVQYRLSPGDAKRITPFRPTIAKDGLTVATLASVETVPTVRASTSAGELARRILESVSLIVLDL